MLRTTIWPTGLSFFKEWLDPADIVAVSIPGGSVMLWRPTLQHSVTPKLSATERKGIYVSCGGYSPRTVG